MVYFALDSESLVVALLCTSDMVKYYRSRTMNENENCRVSGQRLIRMAMLKFALSQLSLFGGWISDIRECFPLLMFVVKYEF